MSCLGIILADLSSVDPVWSAWFILVKHTHTQTCSIFIYLLLNVSDVSTAVFYLCRVLFFSFLLPVMTSCRGSLVSLCAAAAFILTCLGERRECFLFTYWHFLLTSRLENDQQTKASKCHIWSQFHFLYLVFMTTNYVFRLLQSFHCTNFYPICNKC